MDKKTFLQFLFYSLLILVGWQLLSGLFFQQPERRPLPRAEPTAEEPSAGEPTSGQAAEKAETVPAPPEQQVEERHDLVLRNERLEVLWTNRGAALERMKLLPYHAPYFKTGKEEERPRLSLLRDFQEDTCSEVIESITFLPSPGDEETSRREVATAGVLYRVVSEEPRRIVFEATLDPKLAVRKTITLPEGAHHYNVELRFISRTDGPLRFSYKLRGPAGIERENLQSHYISTVCGVREAEKLDVSQVGAGKLTKGSKFNESTDLVWAGVVSQYFVSILKPDDPKWISRVESRLITNTDILQMRGRWEGNHTLKGDQEKRRELARSNATAVIHSTEVTLEGEGSTAVRSYKLIGAPIKADALKPYGEELIGALRSEAFGGFLWVLSLGTISWLSPIMLAILKFFYSIIPNYGLAIVLLTLLVRGILHPLQHRSQASMHKMKLLQPMIHELQKKHGDDRQKLTQEQLALYKKYGVSPMSGCWPIFLQMPVFIALFTTLRTSVQLRQALFIPGWITDLSQSDTVWHLPWHLPIVGNELNILPFVMVVVWMLNQRFMPTPSDPRAEQQQKMMKWMPVLFAVILYQRASGLLVYITVSSGVGALQNWWIRRHLEGVSLEPAGEKKKKTRRAEKKRKPGGEKRGLFGKLMDWVEQQEKQSRQARSSKKEKEE